PSGIRLLRRSAILASQVAPSLVTVSSRLAASTSIALPAAVRRGGFGRKRMKDFSNAAFSPELISIMKSAMDAAVATLPEPVSSTHVQSIAETILRTAQAGETDPVVLQRMALLELQLKRRD